MPGESGLEVVKSLRESDSTISIIVLTGYGSIATAIEAVRRGADHYLTKPVDVDQILAAYEDVNSPRTGDSSPPATVPTLARVEWEHIQRQFRTSRERGRSAAGADSGKVPVLKGSEPGENFGGV